MAVPRQMTHHTLEPLKGWPSPSGIDFTSKISANVTFDPVYAGRVVHLNSGGEFEMGLPNTIGKCHMPIFLFPNSDDPDVSNEGGAPATDAGAWVASAPAGNIMGLVGNGAYELETTEYDPSPTYAPGDGLTATADNTNATTGGRITRTTSGLAYSEPMCGVVSRGEYTNAHNQSVLAFWPKWLPRQS